MIKAMNQEEYKTTTLAWRKIVSASAKILMLVTATGSLVATGSALAGSETADELKRLEGVKQFLVVHGDRMLVQSQKMRDAGRAYYDLLNATHFDYDKAYAQEAERLSHLIKDMKQAWLESHNNYEAVEGIVAGVPSLAKYDLIIDAGVPVSEGPEDISPYDLTLPNGKVMKRPGNLFHYHLETALWSTVEAYVGKKVDLDGNG